MPNKTRNKRITIGVSDEMKTKIENESEERSMAQSTYTRLMIFAGRKQLIAVEEELEEGRGLSLEQEVLDVVPREPVDAIPQDEIATQILDKIEQRIYEHLDTNERIQHSAANGGYYLE